MKTDFYNDGTIRPDAKAIIKPLTSIHDVDKFTVLDPNSWANLKAWVKGIRMACEAKK